MIDRRIGKIKIRRGTDASRKLVKFEEGEVVYSTDTKRVYIGDGSTDGGKLISNRNIVSTTVADPDTSLIEEGDIVYKERNDITYMVALSGTPPTKKLVPIMIGIKGILNMFSYYLPLAGGTMTGNINMNNNKIINLPLPIQNNDAVNKVYVDDKEKLLKAEIDELQKLYDLLNANCLIWEDNVNAKTYEITVRTNKLIYAEGDTAIFDIVTTNVANGTILQWELFGDIGANDIVDSKISGDVTINSNKASISIQFLVDSLTETQTETSKIQLSFNGDIVATSASISLVDPTILPPSTGKYRLLTAEGNPMDTSTGDDIIV